MKTSFVLAGDLIMIAVVTVIGFATHGEAEAAFLPRMLVIFLPTTVGWLALAPFFELYRSARIADPKQLWRPALAMVFAVPAALVLRAMLLNTVVIPIFALVMAGVCALGMLLWRGLAAWIAHRRAAGA